MGGGGAAAAAAGGGGTARAGGEIRRGDTRLCAWLYPIKPSAVPLLSTAHTIHDHLKLSPPSPLSPAPIPPLLLLPSQYDHVKRAAACPGPGAYTMTNSVGVQVPDAVPVAVSVDPHHLPCLSLACVSEAVPVAVSVDPCLSHGCIPHLSPRLHASMCTGRHASLTLPLLLPPSPSPLSPGCID